MEKNILTKEKIREIANKIVRQANLMYGTKVKIAGINVKEDLGKNAKGLQIIGTAQVKGGKYYLNFLSDSLTRQGNHIRLDTIPHEIAHLVCFDLAKQDRYTDTIAHGPQWKKIAKSLGSDGMAASQVSIPRKDIKQYAYRTTTGNIQYVPQRIHNNIQKKFLVYKTKSGSRITAASFIEEIN
jgi:predicted SprT family Zn-dependent metalloprotease